MIKPLGVTAIALNVVLLIGLAYKAVDDPPVNERGWIWMVVFLACPAINLLGLFWRTGRAFTVIAAFSNGAAILVWGGLIALMMVWPLGNKPKGIELLVLLGSWLILVLTEVALVRLAASKQVHRS